MGSSLPFTSESFPLSPFLQRTAGLDALRVLGKKVAVHFWRDEVPHARPDPREGSSCLLQLQIGLLFGFWKEEKKERWSGGRVSEKGGEEREERRSRWC